VAAIPARPRASCARSRSSVFCRARRKRLPVQVVVEAQQRAIDKDPDQPLRNLSIDAGAMRARRIIDDMISSKRRTAAA
jgi:hypothetical protein